MRKHNFVKPLCYFVALHLTIWTVYNNREKNFKKKTWWFCQMKVSVCRCKSLAHPAERVNNGEILSNLHGLTSFFMLNPNKLVSKSCRQSKWAKSWNFLKMPKMHFLKAFFIFWSFFSQNAIEKHFKGDIRDQLGELYRTM